RHGLPRRVDADRDVERARVALAVDGRADDRPRRRGEAPEVELRRGELRARRALGTRERERREPLERELVREGHVGRDDLALRPDTALLGDDVEAPLAAGELAAGALSLLDLTRLRGEEELTLRR